MLKKLALLITVALLLTTALVSQSYAATEFLPVIKSGFGLEVDPPEIAVENAPLGEKAALSDLGGEKMKLRIQNKGTAAYTYTINVLFVSEAGDSLKEGYIDIPDKSWIIPENKEVRILANSAEVIELYLKIPKRKAYYDKKYQAVIEVKSKKNRPEDILVLAVQLRMCFSARGQESYKNHRSAEGRKH